ncbi:MAG: ABC transporter ATP-binding protein [Ignavibacteriales bacterium]|nr:ABC transporter ATP-binding protein [Ignavibacteriales bacterium]
MLNVDIENIILNNNNTTSRELLRDIKFKITENKIYTVLGKNGSGKSTLIKSLTGLFNTELYKIIGSVFWFDENIFKMDYLRLLELRKKEIKYVLQNLTNNFDPLKKIKYYFENSGLDAHTITAKLKEFLLPDYQTISDLHSYEISGGMAQRLSLMLAMLSNPKLLILDEPTSAIDYANINLIKLKLLDFKNAGGSALIVTQDINFAKEVSDKLAFLQDNKLSAFAESEIFFRDDEQKSYSDFLKSFKVMQ